MPLLPALDFLSLLGFGALLVWAAYTDIRSLTIPNRISVAIALLFAVHVLAAPQPIAWTDSLLVGGGLLVLGFLLFSVNAIGGGDAKLLAATSLWAGTGLLLPFLLYTVLTGGGLAILMWLHHRLARAANTGVSLGAPVEEDFGKRPMPYAVAIAIAGLYVAFTITSVR